MSNEIISQANLLISQHNAQQLAAIKAAKENKLKEVEQSLITTIATTKQDLKHLVLSAAKEGETTVRLFSLHGAIRDFTNYHFDLIDWIKWDSTPRFTYQPLIDFVKFLQDEGYKVFVRNETVSIEQEETRESLSITIPEVVR